MLLQQKASLYFLIFVQFNSVDMDQNTIVLIIAVFALLVSLGTFFLFAQERKKPKADPSAPNIRPLMLQAYERLVMLTERISIPNLVSRANQPGLNAKEMQLLLLESIKQEFEYNATQQIYVSPVAWDAVRNLKDQNMLIINQVASTLPENSTGLDLNKRLLEYMMTQKKGSIHTIVLEALNYEAKKIMR
jgi:hypothetical protein